MRSAVLNDRSTPFWVATVSVVLTSLVFSVASAGPLRTV